MFFFKFHWIGLRSITVWSLLSLVAYIFLTGIIWGPPDLPKGAINMVAARGPPPS